MIVLPSKEDLRALSEEQGEVCVSLYMPTFRKGVEVLQGPVRLKNLLRRAGEQMESRGIKSSRINELIQPALRLQDDLEFWQHQSDGLALFFSPEHLQVFRLPLRFDEFVLVNSHFYLKPLLRLLSADSRYFVLGLGQQYVHLFEASQFSIREVPLHGIPRNLDEAMQYEDTARAHHFSPGGQGRAAGSGTVFHGHGVDASDQEEMKSDILQFFQMVEKGVHDVLKNENAPLVLIGLEYLHSIFRHANRYPYLLEHGVNTNPEERQLGEIHQMSWEVVKSHFERKRQDALQMYLTLANKGRASSTLEEVVPAAMDGRVETLLVPDGLGRWGVFHPDTRRVELRDHSDGESQELLDLAAIQTFLNGGVVYAVGRDLIPGHAPVAAVFRY